MYHEPYIFLRENDLSFVIIFQYQRTVNVILRPHGSAMYRYRIMREWYNIRLQDLVCGASISGGRDALSPGKYRAIVNNAGV